ncbi:MAG: diacylglycerol kinase family lipid kinase [Chloroflexota bacterium]|nr:diacylglycerol kinase family lipid kinase [Chloroflexota bacterium]
MSVATSGPGRSDAASARRWGTCDIRRLRQPAALVFNPHAGRKLGLATNTNGQDEVQAALRAEGIRFDLWATERSGHATELARRAVVERRELVIVAGGDGTVNEVAHGLANTDTVLALMPLGSIMNMARTLWIPRDLTGAARTIAEGKVLAMDMGRVGEHYFLEAAGVGVVAGLFGYFDNLDSGGPRVGVLRAALRFARQLGTPHVRLEYDGGTLQAHAPAVSIANGPYVGAAYANAPAARIDDGLLDITVFGRTGLPRLLVYLALIAGGRPSPLPAHALTLRAAWLRVAVRHRDRPLPVHADGVPVGITPTTFEVAPAALRVVVGPPADAGIRAWELVRPMPS